jgi:hypothetical protein
MDRVKTISPGMTDKTTPIARTVPHGTTWKHGIRGIANLLKMGHCAPSIMQTILDGAGDEKDWLVKLMAGMPGGIGNTGTNAAG